MVSDSTVFVVYVVGVTVLFFFWVYGIASFVLDVKNKFIPAAASYWRRRKEQEREEEAEQDRSEQEQQLL